MPRAESDAMSAAAAGSRSGGQRSGRQSAGAGAERSDSEGLAAGMSRLGSEAMSSLGDAAEEAKRQARDAAGSLASQAGEQVRALADRQIDVGADMVAEIAESFRSAAISLDASAPQLAGLALGAADRIDDFSETIRGQSATELAQAAADFARRRPALLFGAAALGGFLLVRLLNASPAATLDDEDDDAFDELDDIDADLADFLESDASMNAGGRAHGE